MKKFLLILLSFAGLVCANDDTSFRHEQLIYNIGVELATHETIVNWDSLKKSAQLIYDNIEESQEYFNGLSFFMGADESDSVDEVMDLFELILVSDGEKQFKNDLIDMLLAYQNVFYLFHQIAGDQESFDFFIYCTHNRSAVENHVYNDLYEKLNVFEEKLELFTDRCDQLYFDSL